MAEGIGRVATDRLKAEISCPLCLEIFKEPKALPCQHVYCKAPCLEGLALRSGNGTINCPECRTVAQVPGNDLDNLPTALHISRLEEVYKSMQLSAQPSPTLCNKHKSQSLDLYCETCQKLVCRDCILADCLHKEHKYGYVTEVVAGYREELLKTLVPAEQLHARVSRSLITVADVKGKISEQKTTLVGTINTSFDNLIGVLQEQKQRLVQGIEHLTDGKLHAVSVQEEELKAVQLELQQLVASVKEKVQNDSNEQLLSRKKTTTANINEVVEALADLSLQPAVLPDVAVQVTTEDELRRLCEESSRVYRLADPSKCTVEGQALYITETDTMTSLTLHLKDCQGSPCIGKQDVTAELKSLRNGLLTPAHITPSSTGRYQISYETESRGRHELNVKVNGIHIRNSPCNVFVRKLPINIGVPVKKKFGLKYPTGLGCADNKLYVVDHGQNSVLVFDHSFRKTATIGGGVLRGPAEIALDQHSIYVCTVNSDQVHKFTKEGRYIKSTGGRGINPGEFNYPNGNRVSKDNKLYVCDSENHRIQVLDTDLNVLKVIGSKGSWSGRFNFPADVDFDSSGNLYVVDKNNSRVQVLTPDSRHIRNIGKKATLNHPMCIQVVGELVYVTRYNGHCVSVFHTSGEYITNFGEGHLYQPEGIAVDEDGYVYVSNNRSCVVVF